MCDYAVGLSRQLNGSIIPSERKFLILILFNFLEFYLILSNLDNEKA